MLFMSMMMISNNNNNNTGISNVSCKNKLYKNMKHENIIFLYANA